MRRCSAYKSRKLFSTVLAVEVPRRRKRYKNLRFIESSNDARIPSGTTLNILLIKKGRSRVVRKTEPLADRVTQIVNEPLEIRVVIGTRITAEEFGWH